MVQERYVYHIKDSYFEKAKDDKLMANKENGRSRPTFFCMEDLNVPGLLWLVPISSRVAKYTELRNKQIEKYGKCNTIVIGKYDGREAAFLVQNMFPATAEYLDHVHTRKGNPVPVSHTLALEVRRNLQQLRQLHYRGCKVVFTDVTRLEGLMRQELESKNKNISFKDLPLEERISVVRAHQKNSSEKQSSNKARTQSDYLRKNNRYH